MNAAVQQEGQRPRRRCCRAGGELDAAAASPRSRPAARHQHRHQQRCRAPSTATVASSHCAIVASGAACALALTAISAVDAAASSIAAATSELPDGLPQSGSPISSCLRPPSSRTVTIWQPDAAQLCLRPRGNWECVLWYGFGR